MSSLEGFQNESTCLRNFKRKGKFRNSQLGLVFNLKNEYFFLKLVKSKLYVRGDGSQSKNGKIFFILKANSSGDATYDDPE